MVVFKGQVREGLGPMPFVITPAQNRKSRYVCDYTGGMCTMSDVTIRPAVVADASDICACHQSAVRVLCGGDYTSTQIEAWIGTRTPLDYVESMKSGEALWVAEVEGQVVGFAGRKDDEITAVYVSPRYARQGIGQQLLQAVEQSAAKENVDYVSLDASLTSVPFYSHEGYTFVKQGTHRLRSGVEIACVRMEKHVRFGS